LVLAAGICDKGLEYSESFLAVFALKKLPFLASPWKQEVWLGNLWSEKIPQCLNTDLSGKTWRIVAEFI